MFKQSIIETILMTTYFIFLLVKNYKEKEKEKRVVKNYHKLVMQT